MLLNSVMVKVLMIKQMTLTEFIERYKTDVLTDYEVKDDEVIFNFDTITKRFAWFLAVPGNEELELFSELLNGRVCVVEGNNLNRSKLAIISVDMFMVR